ncbi:MAG: PaaI family thioesterase [Burkholderiales bacterium]
MSDASGIPEGFEPIQRIKPNTFAALAGPFYWRRLDGGVSVGLRVETRHCNTRGTCHGGLLATLADIALGYTCAAAAAAAGKERNFVTIDLSVEYMASTQAGDWLYSEVKVLNADTRTAAAAGHLLVEGRPVARISANFRLVRSRAPQPAGTEEI